jgi:hypothetical protein
MRLSIRSRLIPLYSIVRWRATAQSAERELAEKTAASARAAADRQSRAAVLKRLADAETRVFAAQQQARLEVAAAERKEADLLRFQEERRSSSAAAVAAVEAQRRAALLLSNASWGKEESAAGKVSKWSPDDVLEWFGESFAWANRYTDKVQMSGIDGESLLVMDDQGLLHDFGVRAYIEYTSAHGWVATIFLLSSGKCSPSLIQCLDTRRTIADCSGGPPPCRRRQDPSASHRQRGTTCIGHT